MQFVKVEIFPKKTRETFRRKLFQLHAEVRWHGWESHGGGALERPDVVSWKYMLEGMTKASEPCSC